MNSVLEKRELREGVTTGSCAAAAAKAAALWITCGECPESVEITTPPGRIISLDIVPIEMGVCGVVKDAGDDPDATNGMTVISKVEINPSDNMVLFEAGEGVGRVTLPGLKIPPGEAAINPVPREMITSALRDVIGACGAKVTVSVPGGAEIARKTFNPRLGIEGGISILGTTGIVKPMNEQAIFDSFTLELRTHIAEGRELLGVTFGNTGEIAMRRAFDISGRCIMQCGNYIGYVLDEAVRLGIKRVLLCGHPGKLLKVAAGTFYTHNRTGDGRKEALCTHAAIAGFSRESVTSLYKAATTDAAIDMISELGRDDIWDTLASVTAKRCIDREFGEIEAAAAYIGNDGALLGKSSKALIFAEELKNER